MSSPRVKSSRNMSSFLIRGPDGKSAPVFPCSVVSPPLSCLLKRQLNRHSTVFDWTLPVNYSSPPHPLSVGKESWHFAQSMASYWKSAVFRWPDCIQILAPVCSINPNHDAPRVHRHKIPKNQFCEIVCVSWSKRRIKCQTKTWSNTLFNLCIDLISGYIFEFYCLSWVFSFRAQSYFFIMQIIPAPINNADVTF